MGDAGGRRGFAKIICLNALHYLLNSAIIFTCFKSRVFSLVMLDQRLFASWAASPWLAETIWIVPFGLAGNCWR